MGTLEVLLLLLVLVVVLLLKGYGSSLLLSRQKVVLRYLVYSIALLRPSTQPGAVLIASVEVHSNAV